MQDKAEITFLFEQNDSNTEFVLVCTSPEPMTQDEYLMALMDFVENLGQGNIDFMAEASDKTH